MMNKLYRTSSSWEMLPGIIFPIITGITSLIPRRSSSSVLHRRYLNVTRPSLAISRLSIEHQDTSVRRCVLGDVNLESLCGQSLVVSAHLPEGEAVQQVNDI